MDVYDTPAAEFFTGKGDNFTTVGDWIGRVPALQLANPKPGEIVVDAGCGAGLVSRMIARITGPGTVYGCDLSETMLAAARTHEEAEPLAIDYQYANITERLPYPDNFANLVVCIAVTMHLKFVGINSFVANAERVLKPGGRLLVSTIHPDLFQFCNGNYPQDLFLFRSENYAHGKPRWIDLQPTTNPPRYDADSCFNEHYTDRFGNVFPATVWHNPVHYLQALMTCWGRLNLIRKQETFVTPEVIAKSPHWAGSPTGHPAFIQFLAQKP